MRHTLFRPRRTQWRKRRFMIDAEEFDFMDDLEVEDWMIAQTEASERARKACK